MVSPKEWFTGMRTYFVEIAFIFYFLGKHMSLPLFQEFIQRELKKTIGDEMSATNRSDEPTEALDMRHESAITILSLQVAESLPAIVMVLTLGAVSDRMGNRKILLWLPSLGMSSYAFMYIMSAYTGWQLNELFLAAAIRGLSGSTPCFHAGASYFAVNATKPENRTFRLACQEFINSVAFALGNLIVGYWVESSGFIPAFWFVFACSCTSLFVSLFFVQELSSEVMSLSNNKCCQAVFGPLVKFLNCGDKTCVKLWLIIASFQLYSFIQTGQENTYVFYLHSSPFSWDESKIGVYLCVMMGLSAAGTLFGIHIMQTFFRDARIVLVGFFSKAVGTLWFAVVRTQYLLYGAPILSVFQLLPMPILRSMVSNLVKASDHASAFALMHSGESLTFFLAPLLFTSIYNATVDIYTGMVFLASCLMILLPTVTILLTQFVRLEPEPVYTNVDQDTEVTASTERLTETEIIPEPV